MGPTRYEELSAFELEDLDGPIEKAIELLSGVLRDNPDYTEISILTDYDEEPEERIGTISINGTRKG